MHVGQGRWYLPTMDFNLLLRNREVLRVLVGVPDGHQHLRARVETAAGDVITLQEATLAALARAYLQITTHPTLQAVELRAEAVATRKDGFAEFQLLDTTTPEAEVRKELASRPAAPPLSDSGAGLAPVSAPSLSGDAPQTAIGEDLWTDHGSGLTDETDDLELDEAEDEPVFGDVPTHHSRPPESSDA